MRVNYLWYSSLTLSISWTILDAPLQAGVELKQVIFSEQNQNKIPVLESVSKFDLQTLQCQLCDSAVLVLEPKSFFTQTVFVTQQETETDIDEEFLMEPSQSESLTEPIVSGEPIESRSAPVFVREIKVFGSTVFNDEELDAVVQPFEGRELTRIEIGDIADQITQLYLNEGYLTSRASQPQITENGILEIQVTEGRLAEIQVLGTQRLNESYIRSRIRLGANEPLNTAELESQLRLLRIDPLFNNVEASLRSSGQPGESILIVQVEESEPFIASAGIDNYSPPSLGSEEFGVNLGYRNVTGIGDEIAGSYYRSTTDGSENFDFIYRAPLNPMNGTLQLRAAPNRNRITQPPFDELDIRAEQEVYELTYRQPIVRSPTQEFALSLGFTYQDGQTFAFGQVPLPFGIGPDENGVSRTSVINFGQDFIHRDPRGAWAFRSRFSLGIDLFDATINDPPIPDGRFFSWLGQVQRVQQLSDAHLLLIQLDTQLTPDSLLPAQQFVIGGGQSVRGYRQNVRSGDNGVRFSIEDRMTVFRNESGVPTVQVAPFLDVGAVWNQPDNPNELRDQTFLVGAGLGLLWDEALFIEGLSIRLDYGIPFINLDDRGDNAQDDGFYFNVRYEL